MAALAAASSAAFLSASLVALAAAAFLKYKFSPPLLFEFALSIASVDALALATSCGAEERSRIAFRAANLCCNAAICASLPFGSLADGLARGFRDESLADAVRDGAARGDRTDELAAAGIRGMAPSTA